MRKLFLISILLTSLYGCRTIKENIIEENTTTVNNNIISKEKDSIFVYKYDSVFVRINGDTIFIEKWHTLYKDRIYTKYDTVRLDSIIYKNKEVYKEKQMSKMAVFWQMLGKILAGLVFVYILLKLILKKYRGS